MVEEGKPAPGAAEPGGVGGAGGEAGQPERLPIVGGQKQVDRLLASHEARVAIAAAKRASGQKLTTRERWLLSYEDRNVTPEAAAVVLGRILAHVPTPGVPNVRPSTKIAAFREFVNSRDGPDPEAPPAPATPAVTVNVGVGVSLTVADLEAAKESARRKLTAIMARVSSVPARVVDSGENGSHGGNGSASPAADGAGGGSGPAAGGP